MSHSGQHRNASGELVSGQKTSSLSAEVLLSQPNSSAIVRRAVTMTTVSSLESDKRIKTTKRLSLPFQASGQLSSGKKTSPLSCQVMLPQQTSSVIGRRAVTMTTVSSMASDKSIKTTKRLSLPFQASGQLALRQKTSPLSCQVLPSQQSSSSIVRRMTMTTASSMASDNSTETTQRKRLSLHFNPSSASTAQCSSRCPLPIKQEKLQTTPDQQQPTKQPTSTSTNDHVTDDAAMTSAAAHQPTTSSEILQQMQNTMAQRNIPLSDKSKMASYLLKKISLIHKEEQQLTLQQKNSHYKCKYCGNEFTTFHRVRYHEAMHETEGLLVKMNTNVNV